MFTKTAPNEAILRARVAARDKAANVARQDSYNLLFDNYREHFEVIAAYVEAGLSVEEISQELDDIWGKDCIPALKQRMILAAEWMAKEQD